MEQELANELTALKEMVQVFLEGGDLVWATDKAPILQGQLESAEETLDQYCRR